MANYLVASGSRKISQLEIATNPVPAGSSSAMPLIIGDAFPATNATTVQITPDAFLSNLVFDASEEYTGNNTFTGLNTFTDFNTFSGNNVFSGVNLFTNNNSFSGSVESDIANIHTNVYDSVTYTSFIQGGKITMFNETVSDALRIRVDSGNGVKFEDFGGVDFGTFMEVQTSQGDVHLKRNTVISGSLTVKEVFYVFETASVLNSSGSSKIGDSIDDTHQFTGSIKLSGSLEIVNGGLLDGVDLSVFSSSVQSESESFARRVSQNEGDISLLSGSFEATSSKLIDASGSFSVRNTDLEFFSSSQYNNDSSSFSVRNTDLEFFSSSQYNDDSSSFATRLSGLSTDSASFSARVSQNEGDISLLSGSYENFSGSQYITDSGSFSLRVSLQENFSGSQYNNESASFSTDITQNTGDISLLSSSYENFSGSQYITDSGSFSTRLSGLSTDSASLSIRVSQNEGDISLLSSSYENFSGSQYITDSGSFSTRVTTNETDISNLQTDSGSFSARVTTNETNISNLQTDSGSFSTRVTDQESFSSSFDSNVLTYIDSLSVVSGSSQVVFNDVSLNPFVSTSAAISASNHFIPSDNEVYDLGTPTQRWRDIYLSGSTIDLGGLLIQKGDDGNVRFIDSASQATKSVSIDSITGSLNIDGSLTVNDITASGKLGIGASTNPVYKLEVSTAGGSERIRVGTLQNNDNTARFEAITSNGVSVANSAWLRVNDADGLTIGTSTYTKSGGDGGDFSNLSSEVETSVINITNDDVTIPTGNLTLTSGTVSATTLSATNVNATNVSGKLGSWFNAGYVGKTVSASGTAVLTIDGGSNINIADIDIRVYFDGNSALNAQFGYYHVSRDTSDTSYSPSISEYYNESVGSFQVATTDFGVSFSGDDIIITYTNQASGTNGILFYVKGLYNGISIA